MLNDISGPVIAVIVVCIIGLGMRWAFKPTRPRTGPIPDAAESAELGLLDVIAPHLSRSDALRLRARLDQAGIRSSMSRRHDGAVDVLVFRSDAERARELLS